MSPTQKNNVARIVSDSAEPETAKQEPVAPAQAPAAEAPAPQAPQGQAAAPTGKKKRGFALPVIAALALAGAGWYGYDYWTTGRFMVSTDDAYIQGDIATISPKVTGYVAKVDVVSNQQVKAGDVLATLDDGDYKLALSQAQAQVDTEAAFPAAYRRPDRRRSSEPGTGAGAEGRPSSRPPRR